MRSVNICVCRESDAINKCLCVQGECTHTFTDRITLPGHTHLLIASLCVCRESDAHHSPCNMCVCAGRVMHTQTFHRINCPCTHTHLCDRESDAVSKNMCAGRVMRSVNVCVCRESDAVSKCVCVQGE